MGIGQVAGFGDASLELEKFSELNTSDTFPYESMNFGSLVKSDYEAFALAPRSGDLGFDALTPAPGLYMGADKSMPAMNLSLGQPISIKKASVPTVGDTFAWDNVQAKWNISDRIETLWADFDSRLNKVPTPSVASSGLKSAFGEPAGQQFVFADNRSTAMKLLPSQAIDPPVSERIDDLFDGLADNVEGAIATVKAWGSAMIDDLPNLARFDLSDLPSFHMPSVTLQDIGDAGRTISSFVTKPFTE